MKLLKKECYYNRWGTRKNRIEFEGEYTQDNIEKIVEDAPFGYWCKVHCVDKDKKLYKGELHEYWD